MGHDDMTRKIALIWIIFLVGMAFFGAYLAPYDPMTPQENGISKTPNTVYFLGTDGLGRDVLSRLLAGAGRTLGISGLSATLAIAIGGILGIGAPMLGKFGDNALVLVMNTLLTFPPLMMALVLLTLLGRSDTALIIAVGISQVGMTAQVIRGVTRQILVEDYILGARACGAGWWRIAWVHVRRGIYPTLGAQMGIVFGYCLFNSAGLNFLGVGVAIGVPEWGAILAEGRSVFRTAPHVAIFAGLLLMSAVIAVNRLVDD